MKLFDALNGKNLHFSHIMSRGNKSMFMNWHCCVLLNVIAYANFVNFKTDSILTIFLMQNNVASEQI